MRRTVFFASCAAALLGAALIAAVLWIPNTFEGDRFVIVSRGESFRSVIDSLEAAGILRSRVLFDAAGRMLGWTTRMQIGKYRFRSGMSNMEILEDLRDGETVEFIAVTIPEGLRATRQARILEEKLGIDSARFMGLVHDQTLIRELGVEGASLEGYLMPATYRFSWQTDEADIIRTQVGQFWQSVDEDLRAEIGATGRSLKEVLTLASIVELETAVDSERAVIAGVYLNRLKKRMRLGADPTIQYALGDSPRKLHFRDLEIASEYNTYRHYGLPPGPVGNPGMASILASVRPQPSRYLYFVANGYGGHTFTKTFQEHRRAIRKLQKVREERKALQQQG